MRYGRLEPNVTHTWFVRWMTNRDEGELQKSFRSLDAAMQEAQLLQREHGPMPNAYIFVEHGRRPNRVTDLLARFKGSWGFVASSPEADQWRWDHQERFSSMTVPSPSETATDVLGGDVLPPGFEGFESNRRRYSVNARDSVAAAREMRRKFHDKEPEHETAVPWDWPDELQEIGTCEAVMYASPKWQQNPRKIIDYKHVAEGPQRILVRKGFVHDHRGSRELDVVGPHHELNDMPDAFAVLDKILGVQVQLYAGSDEEPELPGDFFQIDIPGAWLGAAKHPETGETFLIVYTNDGVHCLIVGPQLGVEKDGIVG